MNAAATAGSVVVGVLLAFLVALGIVSSANASPEPVDQPLVTYGER